MDYIMGFSVGFAVALLIAYLGYVLGTSQRNAEEVDTRIRLSVYCFKADGSYSHESIPVRDQDEAQRVLNEYMFSRIRSAHVTDPVDGKVLAKMDRTGRLIGV